MDRKASNIRRNYDLPPEFWDNYKHFIIKTGVRLHKAKFYVYRARQFTVYLKNVPMHECSPDDVSGFLDGLRERQDIQDWQVEQARDAVSLLLKEYLKVPWAVSGIGDKQTVETEI